MISVSVNKIAAVFENLRENFFVVLCVCCCTTEHYLINKLTFDLRKTKLFQQLKD